MSGSDLGFEPRLSCTELLRLQTHNSWAFGQDSIKKLVKGLAEGMIQEIIILPCVEVPCFEPGTSYFNPNFL